MSRKEILEKAIKKYGTHNQHIVCIEELSELTKEITKYFRGEDNREHLLEELVDVLIMIIQLIIMHKFNEADIFAQMEIKLARLEKGLEE